MLLEKSDRFQKEYKEIFNKISKISDERVKKETKDLLNQLTFAVKEIDRKHMDMVMTGGKLPVSASDTKDSLINLRKKIFSRLQDCERAGLIKE
jgi:GTP-binding protein EngB required for normal cell division